MDFALSERAAVFRAYVKAFLADEVVGTMHESGTFNDRGLNGALADAGLLAGAVPGYGDRDPVELYILFNELEKAGAPYDGLAVTMLVAGVVHSVGTDFHRTEVLERLITGRHNCCLGYSEPDHGSDVAAITTRAVRDGDGWVIDGRKMWTTMAHESDWVLLLTRTDPDVPKHQGLTMFLVPMDTPGIEVQPVATMATERTNATFFDAVRVGDQWRLGEVNGGWSVMGVALALERGVMGGTNPGSAAAAPRQSLGGDRPLTGRGNHDRRPVAAGASGPNGDRQPGRPTTHAACRLGSCHRRSSGRGRVHGQDLRLRGVPAGGRLVPADGRSRGLAGLWGRRGGRQRVDRLRRPTRPGYHHLRRYH